MLDKNSTANGTNPVQLGSVNRTGGNITNHTLAPHSENFYFVMGKVLRQFFGQTSEWFYSWFAPSAREQQVQQMKIKLTSDRLHKLFRKLEEKIPSYRSAPDDASKLTALRQEIVDYFDTSLPYEAQISSMVMAEIYGFLSREKLTAQQITAVTTLPTRQADIVVPPAPPAPTPAKAEQQPAPTKSRLVEAPDTSVHLQVLFGKEFLHLFTGGKLQLNASNAHVAVELGKLFAQYQAQDTSEGFDCELSYDTSLFIGRTFAENSQNLGQRSREYYGLTKAVYSDGDHYQISIKFLQVLLHTPMSRKNHICAGALAKSLQLMHDALMRAQPGQSVGTYEVVDAPAGSGDIETLAAIIRGEPRSFLHDFIPITTISIYEGPTYTADELTYLRGYAADVSSQAPASVRRLVAEHSYIEAVRACPAQDLPELAKHLDKLILSFTKRDETLYRQPERLSDAELINRQRRGVFADHVEVTDEEDLLMLRVPR